MRSALWVNLALACMAVVVPRMVTDSQTAAISFAVPMSLILVIGAAAAIRAYILARRVNQRISWTAFLPLSMFLLGIGGTLYLVYSDFTWDKDPVEIIPGQHK